MLLLLLCILLPSNLAHQIFNYTWQIINEAGDVAFSASSLAATTPWNSLTPDLCRLAAGASLSLRCPKILMLTIEPPPLRDVTQAKQELSLESPTFMFVRVDTEIGPLITGVAIENPFSVPPGAVRLQVTPIGILAPLGIISM